MQVLERNDDWHLFMKRPPEFGPTTKKLIERILTQCLPGPPAQSVDQFDATLLEGPAPAILLFQGHPEVVEHYYDAIKHAAGSSLHLIVKNSEDQEILG